MSVEQVAADLSGSGFYSLVLPFLLVFAIVYGVLKNLGLFDGDKPNVIIAAVIAIFASVFFEMAPILGLLQGPWALWLILLLMVMITLQLVGVDMGGDAGTWPKRIIGGVALLGVLYLFVVPGRGQPLEAVFGTNIGSGLAAIPILGPIIADIGVVTLILIAVAVGAVYWMLGDSQ